MDEQVTQTIAIVPPVGGAPPAPEQMVAAAASYCKALSNDDIDGIMERFAEDAQFADPVGTQLRRGKAEIREFFEANKGLCTIELEGAVRVAGWVAAFAIIATLKGVEQKMITQSLDVVVFDADGKFSQFMAVWGPSNFHTLSD